MPRCGVRIQAHAADLPNVGRKHWAGVVFTGHANSGLGGVTLRCSRAASTSILSPRNFTLINLIDTAQRENQPPVHYNVRKKA